MYCLFNCFLNIICSALKNTNTKQQTNKNANKHKVVQGGDKPIPIDEVIPSIIILFLFYYFNSLFSRYNVKDSDGQGNYTKEDSK